MPKNNPTKLFVLDTNVLLHDPSCLFRFEEHDIYLPMITLEELDNNKKGLSEVARNARQTSRYLEEIMGNKMVDLHKGCSLNSAANPHVSGRLFLQTDPIEFDLPMLAGSIADNQILSIVLDLKKKNAKLFTIGLLLEDTDKTMGALEIIDKSHVENFFK